MRYERMPPAAYAPPMSVAHISGRPAAKFSSSLFSVKVYPLIEYSSGSRVQPLIGPPWLPMPLSRETHDERHIMRAEALTRAKEHTAVVNALPHGRSAPTLLMRGTVFISKKNVNRSAVVRARCRTRLVHALQLLLAQGGVPVLPMHTYIFHGSATLYNIEQAKIIGELQRALSAIARSCMQTIS